ncbi:hypothetical protein KC19_6G109500 [Ceratodon purpureus]|uniref:LysM domain-containing protein n=1 Tax=Ceratodon purpureus TaxID=3225 RepID=A0A8T0HDT8_CERPU|nr:hypothetical protein KC19_6G109500 [Ceratodon purpureus]
MVISSFQNVMVVLGASERRHFAKALILKISGSKMNEYDRCLLSSDGFWIKSPDASEREAKLGMRSSSSPNRGKEIHCFCTLFDGAVIIVGHRHQECGSYSSVRMATNSPRGASSAAKPRRPAVGKRPDKDDNLARAAGAVVAGGIAWSLFRSITGRREQQGKGETLSKDVEQKAVGVADDVEQKEKDVMGTLTKTSYFGNKKLKGKKIEVKDGDTLWGIARKFNVSVDALMKHNGIKDGDSISTGETLIVPK